MSLTKIRRPKTFSEVKGQERAVALLRASLKTGNVPFVTILTGPFGTGKTTLARIIAKSLNCENRNEDGSPCCECESCKAIDKDDSMDVLELDAASNNGVADVLRLTEGLKYSPAKGKFKVYIIDEVHRLSPQAFDTLLKTFEEPPEYARFILCTTEAHKVPATITSRGTKISLEKISLQVIEDTLKDICKESNKPYEDDALKLIAKDSDGHMRDALKELEDIMKLGDVTVELVISMLGIGENNTLFQTLQSVSEGSIEKALALVDTLINKGCNLAKLVKQFVVLLTDLLLYKRTNSEELIFNTSDYKESVRTLAEALKYEQIIEMLEKFNKIYEAVQRGGDEFVIKTGMIELIAEESVLSSMSKRLSDCEKRLDAICSGNAEVVTIAPEPIAATSEKEEVQEMANVSTPEVTLLNEDTFVSDNPVLIEENPFTGSPSEEPLPIMADDPLITDSLPGDILDGFDVGEAVVLGEPSSTSAVKEETSKVIEITPKKVEGGKEETVDSKSNDDDAFGSFDDMFSAFARL